MPRFLFHLRHRLGLLIDEEGAEYENEEAAFAASLRIARDIAGTDIREGHSDLNQSIVLSDESGAVIHECSFRSALDVFQASDTDPIVCSLDAFPSTCIQETLAADAGVQLIRSSPQQGPATCAMSS